MKMLWVGKTKNITAVLVFAMAAAVLVGAPSVSADSASGYAEFPDNPVSCPDEKTGTQGNFSWPGIGDVSVEVENVACISTTRVVNEPTKPEWGALGFPDYTGNPDLTPIMRQWIHHQNTDPQITSYDFGRPANRFAIALADVDLDDEVHITAYNEFGDQITDFTDWTVLGSGDKTLSTGAVGSVDPAPAPTWDPATGTLTGPGNLPENDTNRSFIAISPPAGVRISGFSLQMDRYESSSGDASHVDISLVSFPAPDLDIGDRLWFDTNSNGAVDPGEGSVAGATVELQDLGGAVLETTTTDANGFYVFRDIIPGEYYVNIPASNFMSGGVLNGYTATRVPPVALASANNLNYGRPEAGGVRSGLFTIDYEGGPLDDTGIEAGTIDNYLTLDFGFVPAAAEDGEETLASTGGPWTQLLIIGGVLVALATVASVVLKRRFN